MATRLYTNSTGTGYSITLIKHADSCYKLRLEFLENRDDSEKAELKHYCHTSGTVMHREDVEMEIYYSIQEKYS